MLDFELIVAYMQNGAMALMAVAAYLYLVTVIYPWLYRRLMWQTRSRRTATSDRGIRRVSFLEGYAIVYEPAPAYRRFIRRYALFCMEGCTYIRCLIHPSIAHIRYEVAAFDARGRLLDVVCVSELVAEAGQTCPVRLPRHTAYACVTLCKADAMYEEKAHAVGLAPIGMAVYTLLNVATAVAAAWLLSNGLNGIMAAIPLTAASDGSALTLAASAVLGLATALWGMLMYHFGARRGTNS